MSNYTIMDLNTLFKKVHIDLNMKDKKLLKKNLENEHDRCIDFLDNYDVDFVLEYFSELVTYLEEIIKKTEEIDIILKNGSILSLNRSGRTRGLFNKYKARQLQKMILS